MPASKVRQLVQALAVALALYGCLRWAGFYEFASRDAEGLATLTQLLGDIYAVLLAFTIFVIWGQFTEVENCVIRECNSFDELLRFSRFLNADDAANIRRAVKAYRGQVLDHEWQALGDGRRDKRTEELFGQIINAVVETTPRNEAEQTIRVRLLDMNGLFGFVAGRCFNDRIDDLHEQLFRALVSPTVAQGLPLMIEDLHPVSFN